MKAVVWGCGGTGLDFLDRKVLNYSYGIICFTDNDSKLWGTKIKNTYKIIAPHDIKSYDFDIVIVCSLYFEDIIRQLTDELGIKDEMIISYKEIEKDACDRIISRYCNSKDPEILDALEVYKKGELSFFGVYNPPYNNFSKVFRDDIGNPYIIFEDKRMYYPKEYSFRLVDGKEVVPDILYEQGNDSPHRYIPDGYVLPQGAVILDAGVCEGNFALRFVENASKIYLVESDKKWMDALRKTFAPFADKIVFCDKFLSGRSNSCEITIDELVDGRLDFLKMDIEGSEVYALQGGMDTLAKNNVQCAVCTYHRQNDEKYVSYILESYGYRTKPSKGYVFYSYDETIMDTMDLRRGLIYAWK